MWCLDEQNMVTDRYPAPEDTIEIALVRLDGESFEDAVCNVMAYMADDCMRVGFRRVRFVCKASGDVTTRTVIHAESSAA